MKKVLSLILSICMLTMVFVGCGKKTEDVTKTDPTAAPTTAPTTEGGKTDPTTAPEPTVAEEVDLSEHVELTWYLHGSTVSDDAVALAKINEYLTEKINVSIKPIWGTWGDFNANAVLAINGGDNVDIYFTCSWTENEYNAFARKGAFVNLSNPENNLLEKYAQDTWNLLPKVLTDGAGVTGADGYGVYAIPGYKDIATQNTWDINVTLLEKYGYTIDDIKNTDYYGFGEILETVKKGEGDDFYPLLVEGAVLERMVNNSIIVTGDSPTNNLLSYYIDPVNTANVGPYGNTLLSKFETPEYKKFVEKTREYYLAGYIHPDMGNATTANDTRVNKQNTAQYLIGTQSYSLGFEKQASAERGIEVQYVPCTPAYVDTTSSQGAMMAVSTVSKNPERAVMFLNLLNTDPELMKLVAYGVEGEHYNMVNNEVVFTDKRAAYTPWRNGLGNVTMLPPIQGEGANVWEEFKAYYGAAGEIPILGYAFDNTAVVNEMGALANVAAEYALALNTGMIDPATELPKFIQKLKDNGIDTYVAEANKKLNEFLAEKNK